MSSFKWDEIDNILLNIPVEYIQATKQGQKIKWTKIFSDHAYLMVSAGLLNPTQLRTRHRTLQNKKPIEGEDNILPSNNSKIKMEDTAPEAKNAPVEPADEYFEDNPFDQIPKLMDSKLTVQINRFKPKAKFVAMADKAFCTYVQKLKAEGKFSNEAAFKLIYVIGIILSQECNKNTIMYNKKTKRILNSHKKYIKSLTKIVDIIKNVHEAKIRKLRSKFKTKTNKELLEVILKRLDNAKLVLENKIKRFKSSNLKQFFRSMPSIKKVSMLQKRLESDIDISTKNCVLEPSTAREFFIKLYGTKRKTVNDRKFKEFITIGKNQLKDKSPIITREILDHAIVTAAPFKKVGNDKVPAAMFKYVSAIKEFLIDMLLESLSTGKLPYKNFAASNTILLEKPGDPTKPESYRPISILNHSYKILTKTYTIVLEETTRNSVFRPTEQYACRKKISGCLSANLVDGLISSSTASFETTWVDFKKAYDSLLSPRIRSKVSLKVGEKVQKPFKQLNGLLQGCSLSPLLYICVSAYISYRLNAAVSKISFTTLNNSFHFNTNHIAYMDDMKLFCSSQKQLAYAINILKKSAKRIGLSTNNKKSFTLNKTSTCFPSLLPNESFKYLGLEQRVCTNFPKTILNVENKIINTINSAYKIEIGENDRAKAFKMIISPIMRYIGSNISFDCSEKPKDVINTLNHLNAKIKNQLILNKGWQLSLTAERFYMDRKDSGKGIPNVKLEFIKGMIEQVCALYNNAHKDLAPLFSIVKESLQLQKIKESGLLHILVEIGKELKIFNDLKLDKNSILIDEVDFTCDNKMASEINKMLHYRFQENLVVESSRKFWPKKRKEYIESLDINLSNKAYINLNSKAAVETTFLAISENQVYLPNFKNKLKSGKTTYCRHGCQEPEDLLHILQHCQFSLKKSIYSRHQDVCNIILNHLKKSPNEYTIREDELFQAKNTKLRNCRPDLVVLDFNKRVGFILDVAISAPGLMVKSYNLKYHKYAHNSLIKLDYTTNLNEVKKDINLEEELSKQSKCKIKTIPIIIGNCGEILKSTYEELSKAFPELNIKMLLNQCQRKAMLGSYYILKRHLNS
uniref:Reverse transcriptase domain-containing protein n=1 Tax=Strongyloides papillosus TaxID=174720 RepID=A0A0N5BQ19_STREA